METKRNETELEQLPQENSSDSQTDLESENSEARMPEDGVEGEELGTVSQTETEAEEKPRRSRRTRTPKSESDTEEKEVKTTTRRKRANTRTAVNVLSIDEHRTVETEADKARNDLLDLIESMKTQKILTGTIQGVEQPEDNPSRSLAVIYHGDFKVIIPAEEAVLPPEDNRGRSQEDVMHYTLTKRLGAEGIISLRALILSQVLRLPAGWRQWPPNARNIISVLIETEITFFMKECVQKRESFL